MKVIVVPVQSGDRCRVQRCKNNVEYKVKEDFLLTWGDIATFRRSFCAPHTWKRAVATLRFQALQIRRWAREKRPV